MTEPYEKRSKNATALAAFENAFPGYFHDYVLDVIDTLVQVFDVEKDSAEEWVLSYFRETSRLLGDGAVISALHLEPIQIAADLAGISERPLNKTEMDRYAVFERRRSEPKNVPVPLSFA